MISQKSPDNKYTLILKEKGEIPWGPVYYSAKIENCRIVLLFETFGKDFLWSEDSRYLFMQQWFSTEKNKGPVTGILGIDLSGCRKKILVKTERAFVVPKRFDLEKGILEYEITKYFMDKTVKTVESCPF